MKEKKILLIGGGGHCGSVIDCILSSNEYSKVGIIDNKTPTHKLYAPIVGKDDDLARLKADGWTDAFVTVGSIGSTMLRRKLYRVLKDIGFSIPVIIDSSAVIAENVMLGEGSFIGKKAIINTGSRIGICSIINTGSIVEHDCAIGDFSHISPGVVLCGNVIIGDDTHVGAGSVIRQGIIVGERTLIGVGSVVVKNIPKDSKAYGNPCREVE